MDPSKHIARMLKTIEWEIMGKSWENYDHLWSARRCKEGMALQLHQQVFKVDLERLEFDNQTVFNETDFASFFVTDLPMMS